MIEKSNQWALARYQTDLDNEVDWLQFRVNTGCPSLLATTKIDKAYPTLPRSFFAIEPVELLGAESEGAVGIIEILRSNACAYNIGNTIPPPGTLVLLTAVGQRWIFRYD